MEYVCYEYWLKNPKYKIMEKALNEIRNLKGSLIERIYWDEARYFLKRLNKRNKPQNFPEMFIKYSKEYLADETIKYNLTQLEFNNIKSYYGPEVRHNVVLRSDKAKRNEVINKHLEGSLSGMSRASCITIQDKKLINNF